MKKWIGITVIFAAAALMLGGCGKTNYEHVPMDSQGKEPPVITIEGDSGNGLIALELDMEEDTTGEGGDQEGGRTEEEPVTLLFGGDVLLSDHVLGAYQKGGGIGGVLDSGYRAVIEAADFFMVNQEFPFSSRGTAAEDKQYTFRLPPDKVSMFLEMGIDAVTLANNHALDFGTDALLDSCETLDGAGILRTGAGADLEEARQAAIIELKGTRIGVLGATRVIPEAGWAAGKSHPGMLATYDPAITLEEIRRLRAECDYVAVFVHWGIEREETPQEYQRALGRQYIDAGADLVIGSHPHVLQGIEYYQGRPIVYSLGNFVFGSSIPKTALLQVELPTDAEGKEAGARLRLVPGTSGAGYTRMLTDEDELHDFYAYMEAISFGVALDAQGIVSPNTGSGTN